MKEMTSYVRITNLGIIIENGESISLNKRLTKGTVISPTTKVQGRDDFFSQTWGVRLFQPDLGANLFSQTWEPDCQFPFLLLLPPH